MTATALDSKTALIVVDLQKGIVALPVAHSPAGVVEQSVKLIDAFRAHHLPVVLVNVAGMAPGRNEQPHSGGALPADWAELLPELKQQPDDLLVTKRSWCAFTGTDLDAQLKQAGVTQVVLCGIATSIGVESTARVAHALGYNVTLAVDAMTDLKPEAHANSLERIFPRLGETATAQEIVALLDARRA
ncbi:hydrolase [Burkholderia gladioli]|uniref:isochorismatase family protein n=1 Tax=Burkholderia gladioli TaxID=28095 RepID=UPI00050DD375|nr:isochorismatase family protein [Burkholderia gladioli]KGE10178.1 hydrolase [Burkholderia gladioli]